jgi:hypothetical protein
MVGEIHRLDSSVRLVLDRSSLLSVLRKTLSARLSVRRRKPRCGRGDQVGASVHGGGELLRHR